MNTETPSKEVGRRVLVVEDDASVRDCLGLLLRHYGFAVDSSETIAQGMEMLGREPDFLLLDLMLPDGDGTRLLERVQETRMRTRVVVVTGTSDEKHVQRAQRLRPAQIVHKPLNMLQLMETLREHQPRPAAGAVDLW